MLKNGVQKMPKESNFNPDLDLTFEKISVLSPTQIWRGWTHPETLMKWFCPKPWKVTDCRIDLRPGGEFFTTMQGPGGEKMNNGGCYLEVAENEKLVWTNLMSQGYRPQSIPHPGFGFVVTIILRKSGSGTLYKATVSHADSEGREKHEQMGFQEGWGIAFKQLEELGQVI